MTFLTLVIFPQFLGLRQFLTLYCVLVNFVNGLDEQTNCVNDDLFLLAPSFDPVKFPISRFKELFRRFLRGDVTLLRAFCFSKNYIRKFGFSNYCMPIKKQKTLVL